MKDLLEWAWREIRIAFLVPERCRSCEIMGICRDEDRSFRCGKRGCLLLWQKERDKAIRRK